MEEMSLPIPSVITAPDPSRVLDWTKSHFTIGEVVRVLRLAPRTVTRWFDTGLLEGYRFPKGERRVSRDSLLTLMRSKGIPVYHGREAFRIVLIAVSWPVSRLVQSLFGDRTSVAEATSIFHAGQLCGEYKPAFVVMDLSLGRDAVLDTNLYLSRMSPRPAVVVLLPEDSAKAVSWEGVTTLLQPCDPVQLVSLIRDEAKRRKVDL